MDNHRLSYRFDVDGDNFTSAGEASVKVKKILRDIGFDPETIRRVSIAMYEGEINMVIHAGGGHVTATVTPDAVKVVFTDHGPGIPNVELAMQAGWSTAPQNIRALGFGAGMGLPNIRKYSDDFAIQTEVGKGTTLSITVYAGKESS